MRDLRDPHILGSALMWLARTLREDRYPNVPLSRAYDLNELQGIPSYDGTGPMSNDPALHHSKTPQDVRLEDE